MRRALVIAGSAVASAVALVLVFALLMDKWLSDYEAESSQWRDGATPAWLSGEMGVRIPAEASDRRAGYRTSSRYDTGILAFTLPTADANAYLDRLVPSDVTLNKNLHPEPQGYAPMAGFAHLGLPEPETLTTGLRRTSFCPENAPTTEGRYLAYCVALFAHEYKSGSTRIYIRSTIEPGLSPPPTTPA
ncbi:hypothetical protein BKD26_16540 [Streptomyces sp. CB03238]|nr:hypothetical protein BKD26_16540 [Streptomyces sp. CB03238]